MDVPPRIVIRTSKKVLWLHQDEIDWIESKDHCSSFHVGDECHTVRERIGVIERALNALTYLRINRSTIVNLNRIREVQSDSRGYQVVLEDGSAFQCGPVYRQKLEEIAGFKKIESQDSEHEFAETTS